MRVDLAGGWDQTKDSEFANQNGVHQDPIPGEGQLQSGILENLVMGIIDTTTKTAGEHPAVSADEGLFWGVDHTKVVEGDQRIFPLQLAQGKAPVDDGRYWNAKEERNLCSTVGGRGG